MSEDRRCCSCGITAAGNETNEQDQISRRRQAAWSRRAAQPWQAHDLATRGQRSVIPRPAMISREIPSSRELLPVIGLGTWQPLTSSAGPPSRELSKRSFETFADLGGRLVDSSPMYGRSEAVHGEISAALNLGNRLFLATKLDHRKRSGDPADGRVVQEIARHSASI